MEYRIITAPGTADEHIFDQSALWFLDIHKPLISGNIGAGFCPTSYISVKLSLGDAIIPRTAELQVQGRKDANTGWHRLGTYWVGKRSKSELGQLTITAYNAMRKAQQDYVPLTKITAWPAPMSAVVEDIAAILGVDIDSRTAIKTGSDYMVSYPLWDASNAASGSLTMQEVLSWIAAAHGGNFVVTNDNALYLVPLVPAADAVPQDIGSNCSKLLHVADPLTISRVTVWVDSENYFTAGDDTGHELEIDCPYATQSICNNLLEQLGGYAYVPFKAERATVDVTTEPGDLLQIKGNTYYIAGMDIHCGAMLLADLQAPASAETDDEFPVRSQADRQLAQIKASTAQTAQKVDAVERVSVQSTINYYLATSASSDVTTETEGWTAAMQSVSEDKKYLWHYRKLTYMDGRVEETEPGIIGAYGDTGTNGKDGEDAVTLRIDSSRGTVFKNSAVSTVLSAVIYKGPRRITDISELKEVFGSTAYLEWSWQKMDETGFGTILATDSRIGNDGFTFTLTPEDVNTKVVFMCSLITN